MERGGLEEHLNHPCGRGPVPDGAAVGSAGGAACGDVVRIALRAAEGKVGDASFDAVGCAPTLAAGSACVALVKGAALLEAARVGAREITAELGGLSAARRHAADLAADALHRALAALWRPDGGVLLGAEPNRALVAMSGGVDSAVAALLARDAGHEVVAVTLGLWADGSGDGAGSCCSPEAVLGARALAHSMGLPHLTLDLESRFRAVVVEDFLAEHGRGRTPNPCVRCNGAVRFDSMLALADRIGARVLVTGHYARVERDGEGPLLARAADDRKDQTYMLCAVRPDLLERIRFPLGDLAKPEVREIARSAGLAVADRRESQDLCFLAGTDRERFLAGHGGIGDRSGEIVDREGRVLGRHRGHSRFTVGQRRGLGVAAGVPLYVVATDPVTNRVLVGSRDELEVRRVTLARTTLHRDGACVDRVRLRYRAAPVPCILEGSPAAGEHRSLTIALGEPVAGVAPGQVACLLGGERVLGHGTIAASRRGRDRAPGGDVSAAAAVR